MDNKTTVFIKIKEWIYEKSVRVRIFLAVLMLELCDVSPVWASSQVISQINNIYSLVVGIVAAAGAIVLVWGVFEFGAAYFERDSSSQVQSLKKCVGGLIMMGVSGIIALIKGS